MPIIKIMIAIQKIKKTIDNVSDAFHGSYVGRDENGVSYRDIYEKNQPLVGKRGTIEDKKNLVRDMHKAIQHYEQKKG